MWCRMFYTPTCFTRAPHDSCALRAPQHSGVSNVCAAGTRRQRAVSRIAGCECKMSLCMCLCVCVWLSLCIRFVCKEWMSEGAREEEGQQWTWAFTALRFIANVRLGTSWCWWWYQKNQRHRINARPVFLCLLSSVAASIFNENITHFLETFKITFDNVTHTRVHACARKKNMFADAWLSAQRVYRILKTEEKRFIFVFCAKHYIDASYYCFPPAENAMEVVRELQSHTK